MSFLVRNLRGAASLLLISLNVIVWTLPILLIQTLKLTVPSNSWRRICSSMQNGIGALWISVNNLNLRIFNPVRWEVEIPQGLDRTEWYMVVANHQSWVDILVLQRVLNGRTPFLKFLLKKELFWVPFMGLAWWALDYPFLERSRNPARDLETIRRAAEKFKIAPVSIMNFVEGTRFRPEKHEKQRSPYRHLLKPKAGGLSFLLTAMGGAVTWILDVAIAYPDGPPTLWRFLCGELKTIRIRVRTIPIGGELLGDFAKDKAFRRSFTDWLNGVWEEKDRAMAELLAR